MYQNYLDPFSKLCIKRELPTKQKTPLTKDKVLFDQVFYNKIFWLKMILVW